jgi:hypothetical protein
MGRSGRRRGTVASFMVGRMMDDVGVVLHGWSVR